MASNPTAKAPSPIICTTDHASQKVCCMHGVVTDNDVLLYQNAFTSTKGNDAMACILFNQMRYVKLVTKVEVYKEVIQVLADVNQVSSDSDDDIPLLTLHYKKPKLSDPLATEPWILPSDLDTLGNVAFSGVMSPGVYVVLRRDQNGCKGITVLFSKGRYGRDVVRGFISQEILCEQPCPGMQKLTEYIKAGRAIAAKKGGSAPFVSAEEIFKYVKKNATKKP